jgi:hypothetical protein
MWRYRGGGTEEESVFIREVEDKKSLREVGGRLESELCLIFSSQPRIDVGVRLG